MIILARLDELRRLGDEESDAVVASIAEACSDPGDAAAQLARLPSQIFRWHRGAPRPQPEEPRPAPTKVEAEAEDRRWALIEAYLGKPYDVADKKLEAVRRAQRAYHKHANIARAIFGVYSLPVLYVHPDIALTLAGSGRLIEQVRRRLDETQRFIDVVMRPGSLEPHGAGRVWIRKVRLMHAIRRALARSTERLLVDPLACMRQHVRWGERDDQPIDQVELAFVMLMFSWVVVNGLKGLGYPMTAVEARDHVLAWSVIASMVGVVDELLPGESDPLADARWLFETVRNVTLTTCGSRKSGKVSWTPASAAHDHEATVRAGLEAGRHLMAALLVVAIDLQNEHWPEKLKWVRSWPWVEAALQDMPRVLVRRLAGTETADMLYLGRPPFLHWLICTIALMFIDLRSWHTGGSGDRVSRATREGPLRAAERQLGSLQ